MLLRQGGTNASRIFCETLTDAQLKAVADAPGGRQVLERAMKKLKDSNWETDAERAQMARLKKLIG